MILTPKVKIAPYAAVATPLNSTILYFYGCIGSPEPSNNSFGRSRCVGENGVPSVSPTEYP